MEVIAAVKVFSNHMLLASILDKLTSQELLSHRLVCKMWRHEANRLIRRRQQEFFFSPMSNSKAKVGAESYLEWKNSCNNLLQISFIYSKQRGTFIRASRRLIDAIQPSTHFMATSLDSRESRIESAFNTEVEEFYAGRLPWASPNSDTNFHCKMAGYTLDQFSDFLDHLPDFDDPQFDTDSILPHLSFRFESGRLWGSPEISWFLCLMGPKIRYMTVGINHMCTRSNGSNNVDRSWHEDKKWDHEYQVFKQVPNLQVLTIMMHSKWLEEYCKPRRYIINRERNQPPVGFSEDEGGETGETGPFVDLKCLRFQGIGAINNGHFASWILLKARNVQRVVYEMGFSPSLLPLLGEVNPGSRDNKPGTNIDLTLLPRPVRLVTPITTLCLSIFEDTPQTMENLGQVIELQKLGVRGHQVKTLNLALMYPADAWDRNPYNSPSIPPLLRILKSVAGSLETLTLYGGAGVFLEGLIQLQQGRQLESFPRVRSLTFSLEGTKRLNRPDFDLVNFDANLTSKTNLTLAKVFPQVDVLNLNNPGGNRAASLWTAFHGGQRHEGQYYRVRSVRKVNCGRSFPIKLFGRSVRNFCNLETLCVDYVPFFRIAPVVWSLKGIQTLVVSRIPNCGVTEELEGVLTGLSKRAMAECNGYLERSLPTVPDADVEQFLVEKKAAFVTLLGKLPSILKLDRLKTVKFLYNTSNGLQGGQIFSPMIHFLLFDLLPPGCRVTLWGTLSEPIVTGNPPQIHSTPRRFFRGSVVLESATNYRLPLRSVQYDVRGPEVRPLCSKTEELMNTTMLNDSYLESS